MSGHSNLRRGLFAVVLFWVAFLKGTLGYCGIYIPYNYFPQGSSGVYFYSDFTNMTGGGYEELAFNKGPDLQYALMGFWPLTETSGTRHDTSGHSQDLAEVGKVGSTFGPFGKPCAAFRQGGVLVNENLTPYTTGTVMTVSLWARLRDGVNCTRLLEQWASGGWLVLDATGGMLRAGFGHDGTDHLLAPISTNEWHHITSSWDGNQIRVTLDGQEFTLDRSQMPENPPWVSNWGAPFMIGSAGEADAFSIDANADICEVGLWARALSAEETTELFKQGHQFEYPFVTGSTNALGDVKGSYSGVFSYPQATAGTCGLVSVNCNAKGRFSGKFRFGGSTAGFKGSLDSNGDTSVSFPTRSTGLVTLNLHYSNASGVAQLSGTASGWAFVSTPVVLTRSESVAKHDSTPTAGLYNVTLSGTGNNSITLGFGTLQVAGNGKSKLVTHLIDGTKVVSTGRVSAEAAFEFYQSLYSNKGALGGVVNLDASTCTGTLYWYKPTTRSRTYPSAISTTLSLSGTRQ